MSYPKNLDEYTTEELAGEITRRCYRWSREICPYCQKKMTKMGGKFMCSCKFGGELEKYHTPHVLNRFQYGD